MSIFLRLFMTIFAIGTFLFVFRKLRKSKVQLFEAFLWIVFSFGLVLLGVFPEIAFVFAKLLEIQSPINSIFLAIIFILIILNFLLTLKVSSLEMKVYDLVQKLAIREHDRSEE